MSRFFGVFHHEYRMTVRRIGMWIAYGALIIFYSITVVNKDAFAAISTASVRELWQTAGYILFYTNMFMVLLGGILMADRMQRDFRLGIRELQRSTPLQPATYVLAKYFGALTAVITPMFLYAMCLAVIALFFGAPYYFISIMLTAFLAMSLPAFAFVAAFSLVCPLFMPVRVYQVLFVGYWFWGNYLSPTVFPTISETLIVPSGKYVLYGFFGGFPDRQVLYNQPVHTPNEAILNLLILASLIIVVLLVTTLHLRRQSRQA